jgi:hypothetical protein
LVMEIAFPRGCFDSYLWWFRSKAGSPWRTNVTHKPTNYVQLTDEIYSNLTELELQTIRVERIYMGGKCDGQGFFSSVE